MSTATDMLAAYLAAEAAVLQGQSIQFQGRLHTMADLDKIRKGRSEWEARVRGEQSPGAPRIGGLGYALASFNDQ